MPACLNTAGITRDLEQIRQQGNRLSEQLSKSLSTGAFSATFKNNPFYPGESNAVLEEDV